MIQSRFFSLRLVLTMGLTEGPIISFGNVLSDVSRIPLIRKIAKFSVSFLISSGISVGKYVLKRSKFALYRPKTVFPLVLLINFSYWYLNSATIGNWSYPMLFTFKTAKLSISCEQLGEQMQRTSSLFALPNLL